jgi:hypothetical protein
MTRRYLFSTVLGAIAAMALATCGDSGDGGSSASVTITAPAPVSPNSLSPISDNQPTLTVTNATASSGGTLTYAFQVSRDQSFSSVAAQATGIAQGAGQTSWQVSQPLDDGSYFWKARADVSGVSGPYSALAEVNILGVGTGPGESIEIQDALRNGSTVAMERGGGTFTPEGWRVNTNDDFLRYEVSSMPNGYAQWQNIGLTPQGIADSRMIFGMWDPSEGRFRANPFRVNIQHNWPPEHNPPWLRLRFISYGRQEDAGSNFNSWDPTRVYTWRIEWGPEGEDEAARVLLDGVEMMKLTYLYSYQPEMQWLELGIAERRESVIGLVYRNFAVVRRR